MKIEHKHKDVLLTLSAAPSASENIEWFYFNIPDTRVGHLDMSLSGSSANWWTYKQGLNQKKADGDGYYDVRMNFNSGAGDTSFSAGEIMEFKILIFTVEQFQLSAIGPGSDPKKGPFYFATHVQNTPGTEKSGWIVYDPSYITPPVVPEPTTLLAGLFLILPFGASAIKIIRRNRT